VRYHDVNYSRLTTDWNVHLAHQRQTRRFMPSLLPYGGRGISGGRSPLPQTAIRPENTKGWLTSAPHPERSAPDVPDCENRARVKGLVWLAKHVGMTLKQRRLLLRASSRVLPLRRRRRAVRHLVAPGFPGRHQGGTQIRRHSSEGEYQCLQGRRLRVRSLTLGALTKLAAIWSVMVHRGI